MHHYIIWRDKFIEICDDGDGIFQILIGLGIDPSECRVAGPFDLQAYPPLTPDIVYELRDGKVGACTNGHACQQK